MEFEYFNPEGSETLEEFKSRTNPHRKLYVWDQDHWCHANNTRRAKQRRKEKIEKYGTICPTRDSETGELMNVSKTKQGREANKILT